MAGNWRVNDRYEQRGDRGGWSGDDWRRERGSRDRPDDYAFGRNERRDPREYSWFSDEPGFGSGYDSYEGYGGGRGGYPDFDRSAPRSDDPWRNRSVDRGSGDQRWRESWRDRPTSFGPDWGDQHGRWGGRGIAGGYAAGTRDEGSRDYGYGRGGNREPLLSHERDFWDRASDEVASWFGDDEAARRRRQDEQRDHRGRGPKGYMRSDDRIRDDVSDALSDDPYVDASDTTVEVSGGEVTLSGTVDNRMAKRRAEDCAERISGVSHVQNNLRVKTATMESAAGVRETTDQLGASRLASKYPI